MIENTSGPVLDRFVRQTVSDSVELIATDEHTSYNSLRDHGYRHEAVAHSRGEYVRGNVHTAHIDSFWALIKRGIMGSFHQVSKQYLPLYLNEFAFRHNNRKNPDIFRTVIEAS